MDVYAVLIFTIPIFSILGIYFFIKLLLGEYLPKVKKIIYSVGILFLLTILFYWIHIWIVTAPLAFILLWSSLFICDRKKDVVTIALAITFMMFPLLILFCFFNAMGWSFNHSSRDMKPHIFTIYAIFVYLTVIWFPVFIKCTYMNMKAREAKEKELDKKEITTLSKIETQEKLQVKPQEKANNSRNSFLKINLSGTIFITILLFFLMSCLKSGIILIHPLAFIYTLMQIPLIVILLTIVIISKSSSPNIKTTLILGSLNLFCFPLYPRTFFFCALIISFIFYLISTILAKKIKEVMAISAVNLLIAITAAQSFFYCHHTSLPYAELGKTFFTVSTLILLLAIIVITAYIKYSKIKELREELENKKELQKT